MMVNSTLDQIRTENNCNLKYLFDDSNDYHDSPLQYNNDCSYLEPDQFPNHAENLNRQSYFHFNCRGLSSNWESFRDLLCDHFSFDVVGINEVFGCDNDKRIYLPGYQNIFTRSRDDGNRGAVALFIKDNIQFKIGEDIRVFIPQIFESSFIEIDTSKGDKAIVGVIYKPNTALRADLFTSTIHDIINIINTEGKYGIILDDMNIDLLKYDNYTKTNDCLESMFSIGFSPVITLPTRLASSSATLIDHIYPNRTLSTNSGIVNTDVADNFGAFHITKRKEKKLLNLLLLNKRDCFYKITAKGLEPIYKNLILILAYT